MARSFTSLQEFLSTAAVVALELGAVAAATLALYAVASGAPRKGLVPEGLAGAAALHRYGH